MIYPEDMNSMTTLLIGFFGLVIVPALILSLVLARVAHRSPEFGMNDDYPSFTISRKG